MSKSTIISALALSIAIISAQSPAQASLNSAEPGSIIKEKNVKLITLDIDQGFGGSITVSSDSAPVQVTWSIKNAAKKVGRGAKKVGRGVKKVGTKAGRGVRKANRVIVPSEIRNAASKAKRGVIRSGRYVAKYPYGKRCKPNKYLQPVCTVKSKPAPRARTYRTNTNVHDHRTNVNVHDHRTVRTN
jgi:hypothetical protein